jgi:hypothetical protein
MLEGKEDYALTERARTPALLNSVLKKGKES